MAIRRYSRARGSVDGRRGASSAGTSGGLTGSGRAGWRRSGGRLHARDLEHRSGRSASRLRRRVAHDAADDGHGAIHGAVTWLGVGGSGDAAPGSVPPASHTRRTSRQRVRPRVLLNFIAVSPSQLRPSGASHVPSAPAQSMMATHLEALMRHAFPATRFCAILLGFLLMACGRASEPGRTCPEPPRLAPVKTCIRQHGRRQTVEQYTLTNARGSR